MDLTTAPVLLALMLAAPASLPTYISQGDCLATVSVADATSASTNARAEPADCAPRSRLLGTQPGGAEMTITITEATPRDMPAMWTPAIALPVGTER